MGQTNNWGWPTPDDGEKDYEQTFDSFFTQVDRDVMVPSTVEKTSDYTAGNYEKVLADASSSALTITLPTAASDLQVTVMKIDASNNVTIATPNSETINGDSSKTLQNQYESMTITSNGTNYFVC